MNTSSHQIAPTGVPHDLESERAILGSILGNEPYLRQAAAVLEPGYFYLPAHQHIFQAMLELLARGEKSSDAITISDALKSKGQLEAAGGFSYISELQELWSLHGNVSGYCDIVKRHYMARELVRIATDMAGKGRQPDSSMDSLLAEFQNQLVEMANLGVEKKYSHVQDAMRESLARIQKVSSDRRKITGLETGFIDFDNLTSGLQPGDLLIVAARPSMGKTAFAINMLSHAALQNGKSGLLFSLEMSQSQIADRILASYAQIDSLLIRNGNLSPEDYEKITALVGKISPSSLYLNDTSGISIFELANIATQLDSNLKGQRGHGLDILVVDYLQLVRPSLKHQNREQEISEISRSLKALAKKLNIPVVALSQLNRSLESRKDKRPMMSDIRESGSIEQDADLIAFIYREEVYDKQTPNKNVAELLIEKHRNGSTGKIMLTFQGKFTRFYNMASFSNDQLDSPQSNG